MKPTKHQREALELLARGFYFGRMRPYDRNEWLQKFGTREALLITPRTKEILKQRGWIALGVQHGRQTFFITDEGRKAIGAGPDDPNKPESFAATS